MRSPVRDGRFVVVQRGASEMTNPHAALSSQAQALDIVVVNDAGFSQRPCAGGRSRTTSRSTSRWSPLRRHRPRGTRRPTGCAGTERGGRPPGRRSHRARPRRGMGYRAPQGRRRLAPSKGLDWTWAIRSARSATRATRRSRTCTSMPCPVRHPESRTRRPRSILCRSRRSRCRSPSTESSWCAAAAYRRHGGASWRTGNRFRDQCRGSVIS